MQGHGNSFRAWLWLAAVSGMMAVMAGELAAQAPAGRPREREPEPPRRDTLQVQPSAGVFESQTAENLLRSVFEPGTDAIDFEDGSLNWKGKTFQLGNARFLRARFERYLSTPSFAEEMVYEEVLDRILALLSVQSEDTSEDPIFQAWSLLFAAADFEVDAGNSALIANQVHNAWRIRAEQSQSTLSVDELERLRRFQESIVSNRSRMLRDLERQEEERAQRRGGDRHQERSETDDRQSGILTEAEFRASDLAETRARILALNTQMATTGVQAKLQFQSQILTFVLQRRFQHALIASAFYRKIFRGSAQQLEVGTREIQQFMPVSDFTPTIDSLEFIAREAMHDVRQGMRAVDALYHAGQRYQALERLQETFFLGEYLPSVIEFPAERRAVLLGLFRQMMELRDFLDIKDYQLAHELVEQLRETAPDFPSARILSGIRTAERLSNLSVLAARQSMAVGDFQQAEVMLERAAEIWPLNPAIQMFSTEMAGQANIATQAAQAFDQAIARGDYRAIYDRRSELGVGLVQDPARSERLRSIVERVAKIDVLITQADEMRAQGNPYAAWDLLGEAAKIDAEDVGVARARSRVAPRVAAYAGLLEQAGAEEAAGRLAVSLTHYLAAQDMYPGSRAGREGIERVSSRLMEDLRSRRNRGE